jgi:hypothetical protein
MAHVGVQADERDRVRANTSREVNRGLDQESAARVKEYAHRDRLDLDQRLQELNREWDWDRILEAQAAATGIASLAIGVLCDRRFLAMPAAVATALLLHGLQGWHPLLPLFRRKKVRTQNEIDREFYALKALRGDFADLSQEDDNSLKADAAWRAVCA